MREEELEEIRIISEMYPDGIHKKSQADEMFEKLGYEKDMNNERIRYFKEYNNTTYYIVFFLEYKIYTIGCSNIREDVGVDVPLSLAINKKVEELGWDE